MGVMKIAVCCFVLLVIAVCDASLVRRPAAPGVHGPGRKVLSRSPQNIAAYVGETITFVCEVQTPPPGSRVMWAEFISNQAGSIISDNEFITSHPNRDRYMIVKPTDHPSEFHLQIRDVRLSDGGTYVCQNTLGGPPDRYRGEADLIVLASQPNCTDTSPLDGNVLEGMDHTIECIIQYQGGYAPTMTWTGPPPFQVGNSPPNPAFVWSGVAYRVDRSMDTRAFQCMHNFTDLGELPDDVASNVPDWSYLHRSNQIFVFWGPKGMTVTPIKGAYVVGEVLHCSADAFPPASYQWQNLRTLELFYSQNFTITQSMIGFNDTLRCQAQNLIQGFIYSQNLFVYVYTPAPTAPPTPSTTIPTTTQPLMSDCTDISGHWRAVNPYSELLLEVIREGQLGEVVGLVKNATDTVWVEVIGTVRKNDFALFGLTAIWPFSDGLTGMAAECHRCSGVEIIIGDGMWRSVADSAMCGAGGIPRTYEPYQFNRVGSVRAALEAIELDVWRPTSITKRLGVNLKKR